MRLLLLLAAFMFMATAPTWSQQTSLEFNRTMVQLKDMNRMNPLQHPNMENYDEIAERNIMDSENRVIGEVRNIVVTPAGDVASVEAELDRLRLNSNLYLNFNDMDIQGANNGYRVGFEGGQIEEMFPMLLANIETAAGGSGDFAVPSVIGQRVTAEDGRSVGTVENVLFDDLGTRAEALYIAVKASGLRGTGIAVPFGSVRYFTRGNVTEVSVTKAQADAIVETARQKR